ncbi:hypothetical protein JCM14469_00340 [Desulfatiferula olefinivorans]
MGIKIKSFGAGKDGEWGGGAVRTDHGQARTFTDKHGHGSFGAVFWGLRSVGGPPSVAVRVSIFVHNVHGCPCVRVF